MAESLLVVVTIGVMIVSLLLIIIPAVPVSVLEWGLAMVFGALTGFTRLTIPAAIVVTIFAVLGATSALWMPILGLRGKDTSCFGLIAFFIGMIVGSFLIPIPFIGTIIGGMLGVIVVEYIIAGNWRKAVKGGQAALKTILLSMAAELVFAIAIVITVFVSIMQTG